jgi:hypothetical protein
VIPIDREVCWEGAVKVVGSPGKGGGIPTLVDTIPGGCTIVQECSTIQQLLNPVARASGYVVTVEWDSTKAGVAEFNVMEPARGQKMRTTRIVEVPNTGARAGTVHVTHTVLLGALPLGGKKLEIECRFSDGRSVKVPVRIQ